MKTNIINWFRLDNWQEFNFQYRLVEVKVDGVGNDSKLLNKAFYNALNHLAYSTKGVVATAYHKDKRYAAVKGDAVLKQEVIAGSPMNVTLTPLEGVFELKVKDMDDQNLDLALKFLDSAINWQLNKNRNLWDAGINTFLKKVPLPLSTDMETDIYQGFKFRIVAEDKNNVFICLDLAYRYADKKTLSEVLKVVPVERHNDLVFNKNFLYLNGDDWYTVKGKSIGGSISEHMIPGKKGDISVFDYIITEGKYANAKFKAPLHKDSETLFCSYSANAITSFASAACLAKRIRMAEDELHRHSINDPTKRFSKAEMFIGNYFQQLKFNGITLKIATKPYRKECKTFPIPAMKYGNNAVLKPYEGNVKYGKPIDSFPKRRREYVFRNGILSDSAFTNQFLFVPDTMPLPYAKAIKYYFDKGMKTIAPHFPGFTIHTYSVRNKPFAHKVFADLKKYIEDNRMKGGSALFVLPEGGRDSNTFVKSLHKIIKKELFDLVKIKCVSESSLNRYFKLGVNERYPLSYAVPDHQMRQFNSYRTNTLFEVLIINKKWPFALAENLHHDLYIGIDAHEFYAGFCFFFGNGEKIVFEVDKVSKGTGTFRNEKINYKVISDKIYAVLSRHLSVADQKPRSIVILRDGVSYGEEEKALVDAMQRLTDDKMLDKNVVKTGVIDVAKSTSVPVRAASFNGNTRALENPDCGTYFMMNKKDAFIFNTGRPYAVPGSSKPIHVSFTCGNIDFEKALEDIFRLTQITFSSPDRPTSLPLPLKLIDTLIRDVAHEYDFAFTQEKEVKTIAPSLN
ncbi:MAG: hypothetical protein JNJ75_10540 [Cyclobacteriaceae bacterium]|nr:hypothetical protein [Cyclobacteriaceae bacterium]